MKYYYYVEPKKPAHFLARLGLMLEFALAAVITGTLFFVGGLFFLLTVAIIALRSRFSRVTAGRTARQHRLIEGEYEVESVTQQNLPSASLLG